MVGIGIIAAAFSILPIAMAVAIGRYIDKGNDARAVWYGAALMIFGCAGFLVATSQLTLIVFTAALGAAHMVMTVGLQVLCARQQGPGMMEKMIGNYMVANAIGQGLGAYIVGWTGGAAALPPTPLLFGIGLALCGLQMASSLFLRPSEKIVAKANDGKPVAFRDGVAAPGYGGLFTIGIVSVGAADLIVIYMPRLALRAAPRSTTSAGCWRCARPPRMAWRGFRFRGFTQSSGPGGWPRFRPSAAQSATARSPFRCRSS